MPIDTSEVGRLHNLTKIYHETKPVRVAKAVPVSAVKVHHPVKSSIIFIIWSPDGNLVEQIEGNDSANDVELRFHRRYPWFNHNYASALGIEQHGIRPWPLIVNVGSIPEYQRLVKLQPWTEKAALMRTDANRRERWCMMRDALVEIRRGSGRAGNHEGSLIYARKLGVNGGDFNSDWLRLKLAKLVQLGALDYVNNPDAIMPDGKTRMGDICLHYRATPLCPDLY